MIAALFRRELQHLAANPTQVLNPLAFLFIAVTLFAIAVPGEILATGGIAILWVIVLLTNLLALDSMFRREFDNGVLEQMLVSRSVPFVTVLVKIIAQWLFTGFLCVLLAPVFSLLLGIPDDVIWILIASLAIGTPALTFFGAVGASLTVGFSRGGVILALLVLPLYIPVLIFGVGAGQEHLLGSSADAQLYWLGFISMISIGLGPFAALAGLRVSVQLQ
ncbi:MAG: heme exporter protein CcmB [Pseudomonadales bacterium]|nr:heme exporter protein CcmB [Pseudomonadales bacterium]